MADTATPETGPVDAPASTIEGIAAELRADMGNEPPQDAIDGIREELLKEQVNEAAGEGDAPQEAPGTEDDATDPAEEAPEAEAEAPPQEEQLVTVKVNGEERQVPLSEAIAGYSRTEDYKAKTAAVAEERRKVEAEKANYQAQIQAEHANHLEEATNLFSQYDPVLAEARKLDWDALKKQNPAAFVQAQDAVQERLNAIRQMQERIKEMRTQAQSQQEKQAEQERLERFERAAEKIIEVMPELADQDKFVAHTSGLFDYLRGEGFEQAEISDALDHRVMLIADKARRWDAHVAAQKSLPEKKVVQKSVVKPLTTDAGSRAATSRFPANASRDRKVSWIAEQIRSDL